MLRFQKSEPAMESAGLIGPLVIALGVDVQVLGGGLVACLDLVVDAAEMLSDLAYLCNNSFDDLLKLLDRTKSIHVAGLIKFVNPFLTKTEASHERLDLSIC